MWKYLATTMPGWLISSKPIGEVSESGSNRCRTVLVSHSGIKSIMTSLSESLFLIRGVLLPQYLIASHSSKAHIHWSLDSRTNCESTPLENKQPKRPFMASSKFCCNRDNARSSRRRRAPEATVFALVLRHSHGGVLVVPRTGELKLLNTDAFA